MVKKCQILSKGNSKDHGTSEEKKDAAWTSKFGQRRSHLSWTSEEDRDLSAGQIVTIASYEPDTCSLRLCVYGCVGVAREGYKVKETMGIEDTEDDTCLP